MTIASTLSDALAAIGLAPSTKSQQLANSLIQESDAEQLQVRQTTAAELAAAEAAELAAVLAHETALKPLQARAEELQGLFDAAQLDVAKASAARQVAAHRAGQRIDRLRGALRATASPAIGEFVREMRAALQTTYTARRDVMGHNWAGKDFLAFSNADSVAARAETIKHAIDACGENGSLLYAPFDDDGLTAALDLLRRGIPEIEEPSIDDLRAQGVIA